MNFYITGNLLQRKWICVILLRLYKEVKMKWAVIGVEPTKDYKLFLTFEGGKKRVFDFTPLLEDKINEPLRDINYFMTAKVHHHTVM